MEKCEKSVSSLLLFNCCIASFNAEFVASRALSFASIISQSQDNLFSKVRCCFSFSHSWTAFSLHFFCVAFYFYLNLFIQILILVLVFDNFKFKKLRFLITLK